LADVCLAGTVHEARVCTAARPMNNGFTAKHAKDVKESSVD
jgi:hypothetical protein